MSSGWPELPTLDAAKARGKRRLLDELWRGILVAGLVGALWNQPYGPGFAIACVLALLTGRTFIRLVTGVPMALVAIILMVGGFLLAVLVLVFVARVFGSKQKGAKEAAPDSLPPHRPERALGRTGGAPGRPNRPIQSTALGRAGRVRLERGRSGDLRGGLLGPGCRPLRLLAFTLGWVTRSLRPRRGRPARPKRAAPWRYRRRCGCAPPSPSAAPRSARRGCGRARHTAE